MEEKRSPVFRAMAFRICALVFACWFAFSGLLTWAVAADMRRQVEENMQDTVYGDINFRGEKLLDEVDEELKKVPGSGTANTLAYLPYLYYNFGITPLLPVVMKQTPDSYGSTDWFWGMNDLLYGVEPAAVFYDEAGNVFAKSQDFITFSYTTEEKWKAGEREPVGYGYIDVSDLEDIQELERILEVNPGSQSFAGAFNRQMRLSGYFEADRFYPSVVDFKFIGAPDLEESSGSWENLYVLPPDSSVQTQTYYAWDMWAYTYDYNKVRFKGITYESLTDLAEQYPDVITEGGNLWESVMILPSPEKEDYHGKYSYVLTVRCWPIPYALLRLIPFYLGSAAVVGLGLYLLLRKLRKNIIDPMQYLKRALDYGTSVVPTAAWEELYALETHFASSRKTAAEANTKIQQLQTALDYAHDAEEKRKQLISNITHELKTPLAVIHSYAEALQSDIVQEKRERYLSVVLEETEQMDAMVLQMLELSRLEAGKVRIASDQFSLLQLTRQIAEKFEPLLKEKKLRLNFAQAEEFMIVADIQRIGQVLTNFLSNAVKYATAEGEIKLRVSADRNGAHFSIENPVEKPLSQEALSKVWDSFYRVDPSRTEPGTGLGLTIVKQIVTLHGGTCKVYNNSYKTPSETKFGVTFGFTLPTE